MSQGREQPGGRRSWKRGTLVGPKPVQSKQGLRWLLTFVLLALVAWFVYKIWPDPRGDRPLIVLPVSAYDRLVVPQIAYIREDLAALKAIAQTDDRMQFRDLTALQNAASVGNLKEVIGQLVRKPQNVLILQITGEGISDDGVAYLACSDFQRSEGGGDGRRAMKDLLKDISSSPAALKLVILDTVHVGYDPRLGITANEFPLLIAEEVRKLPASSNTWVLLGCGALETSSVAYGQQRTVLGIAVSEGLSTLADQTAEGNRNNFVSMHEFYRYVQNRCGSWFDPAKGVSQTPVLLKAGEGEIRLKRGIYDDKLHELVFVKPRRNATADSDAPAESTTPKEPSTTPTDVKPDDKTPSSEDRSAPTDEKKSAVRALLPRGPLLGLPQTANNNSGTKVPSTGADAAPVTAVDIADLIKAAWQLRDELQTAGRFTPIHVAPHLWRELEATLLHHERSLRSGRAPEAGDDEATAKSMQAAQKRQLETMVGDLNELRQAMQKGERPSTPSTDSRIGNRLLAAWRRYVDQQKPTVEAYDQESQSEVQNAKDAWLRYRQLVYVSPYYTQTVANYGISSELDSPVFGLQTDFLNALLQTHVQWAELRSTVGELSEPRKLSDFVKSVSEAERRRRLLDEQLRTEGNNALAQLKDPGQCRRINDLLSTPLLDHDRRTELASTLIQTRDRPSFAIPGIAPRSGLSPSTKRWQRLLERVQAEQRLVQLIDPKLAGELLQQISRVDRSTGGNGKTSSDATQSDLWQGYRAIAKTLREFHVSLIRNINEDTLLLLDARDANRVDLSTFKFPEFRVRLFTPPNLTLQLVDDSDTVLQKNAATTVRVKLVASQKWLLDMPVTTEFNDSLLSVTKLVDSNVTSSDGNFIKTVSFAVTPKAEQSSNSDARAPLRIKVTWSSGNQPKGDDKTYRFALPQANRVDLELVRVGAAGFQYDDKTGSHQVELFPNHKTSYQLRLVNKSGQAKSVKVELFRIPLKARGATLAGQISLETKQFVEDTATGIVTADLVGATSSPIALPTDPSKYEVVKLASPVAASPPVAATQPVGSQPAAATAPSPTPRSFDVGRGMLVVVTNTQDPKDRWLKWLQFTPLEPKQYVKPEVAYDPRSRRILVTVRPKADQDGDRQPLPGDDSVKVTWDITDADIAEGTKKLSDSLDSTKEARLFVPVSPDNESRIVKLNVDGYPRAFVYQVSCPKDDSSNKPIPGSDVRRTTKSIRIVGVSVPSQKREYLFPPYIPVEAPVEGKAEKVPSKPTELPRNGKAIFAAPCDPILVRLQADLPIGFVETQEQIQVSIGASLTGVQKLFTDRQFAIQLTSFGEQGDVEFFSKVTDLEVPVDPGSLENEETYIEARVILARNEEQPDIARILLDSDKPHIEPSSGTKIVTKDSKSNIPFVVRDVSGVAMIEYGVSLDGSLDFDPAAIKRGFPQAISKANRHQIDLEFDSKGLEVGKYLLLVRVTDKVGHPSLITPVTLQVRLPVVAPAPPGTIAGVIKLNGQFDVISGLFSVTIQGPVTRTPKIKSDGSFTEVNLPPGKYSIKASGMLQDASTAVGELQDIEPSPPDKIKKHTVSVAVPVIKKP